MKYENAGIMPSAVLFVIALVDLILRARTRVFEGFAYSETRRIQLPTYYGSLSADISEYRFASTHQSHKNNRTSWGLTRHRLNHFVWSNRIGWVHCIPRIVLDLYLIITFHIYEVYHVCFGKKILGETQNYSAQMKYVLCVIINNWDL